MPIIRRVAVPVVGLVLTGVAAFVWTSREPAPPPLPPLAVETLSPPTGIDLPVRVVGHGERGDLYSFDAPVEGKQEETIVTVQLAPRPEWSQFGVVEEMPQAGSLDEFTDRQRRHPADSHIAGDPVVEHSALGDAVRKDLRMSANVTTTQWAVEHDGHLFVVEWMHSPDDPRRPTVEAMIASWRWS
ncbi:hypothetical protein [Cellulomonas sp. URHD0024]|uniref:hypothetical protein n=1 Tax=Cellulomonas sp. URHD0024 TaxID=1302620 RepID=UPI000423374D|nr:hypothetical protein [Cellulomonas sp. URHD0024]